MQLLRKMPLRYKVRALYLGNCTDLKKWLQILFSQKVLYFHKIEIIFKSDVILKIIRQIFFSKRYISVTLWN